MYQELQRRIETAGPVDFGDIFQRSIDLFKKTWSQGLILTLITIAITVPLAMMMYIPAIGLLIENPSAFEEGDFSVVMIVSMVLIFIVALFIITVLTFALNAAFFRMVKNIDHDDDTESASFFMFLKGENLKKSIVLSLATVGISILAALLCLLPLYYVMVPIQFFALFFAFRSELSTSEIINLSFKLGNKKWLVIFGLIIVSSIVAQTVGFILCVVGIFFTASFIYLPVYLVYKDVIGFDNTPKVIQENSISK